MILMLVFTKARFNCIQMSYETCNQLWGFIHINNLISTSPKSALSVISMLKALYEYFIQGL